MLWKMSQNGLRVHKIRVGDRSIALKGEETPGYIE
jgi:hypothetical protein